MMLPPGDFADARGFDDALADVTSPSPAFVDTSALIRFVRAKRSKANRDDPVVDFFIRGRKAGLRPFVTPLVLEEAAHKYTTWALEGPIEAHGCSDAKTLRYQRYDEYLKARAQGAAAFRAACNILETSGLVVLSPLLAAESTLGERLKSAFLTAMEKAPALGAMDCLHLVNAQLLGCRTFITIDGDFRLIPRALCNAIVYCDRPGSALVK